MCEKLSSSGKKDEIEEIKEKERVKTNALKERLQIEVEAKKAMKNVPNTRRAFQGANRVGWGNANGFDAFELGDM